MLQQLKEIMTTISNSYQYAAIQVGHNNDDNEDAVTLPTGNPPFPQERPYNKRASSLPLFLGGALLGAVVIAAMLYSSSSGSAAAATATTPNTASVPVLGMVKPRSCTFQECYNNNCNHEAAPFICLRHNGGPHMGCSPVPWTPETCDDDCDLSGCDKLKIPGDTKTCKGVTCGTEWCKGGQVCPSAASYQCQAGSARFGCSADPLQWTLHTDDDACSKCCDTSSCSS